MQLGLLISAALRVGDASAAPLVCGFQASRWYAGQHRWQRRAIGIADWGVVWAAPCHWDC